MNNLASFAAPEWLGPQSILRYLRNCAIRPLLMSEARPAPPPSASPVPCHCVFELLSKATYLENALVSGALSKALNLFVGANLVWGPEVAFALCNDEPKLCNQISGQIHH